MKGTKQLEDVSELMKFANEKFDQMEVDREKRKQQQHN